MSSPLTTSQHSVQHSLSGFVGRSSAERRAHLRAVPDHRRTSALPAADCDDNCHYCQGPETD